MTERYNVSLLESLEQLPTPQLDAMLQSELEKEQPDEHSVRLILKVLWKREANFPVVRNRQLDDACKRHEKKTRSMYASFRQPLLKAAVAVLVLCILLLFTLPQEASATSIFDRIAAWSESFFGLFERSNRDNVQSEYVFRTNHPDLQELYDIVTELGVTVPVVPMWLDLKYELIDCKIISTPKTTKIHSIFSDSEVEAILEINSYSNAIPREFHKGQAEAFIYERNGISHYIFQNENLWTVVWTQANLECYILIECQEESLYQILDSIYTLED